MRASALVCAALPLIGCDAVPFAYRAAIPEDLVPLTARFEASFFTSYTCEELALGPGRRDLARTATATIRRTAERFDGFPEEDLSRFDRDLSLEVRAIAADGTPLARRCVPVGPTTEAIGVSLSPFAPEGARAEALELAALIAGTASRPARLLVTDGAGAPAEGVLVSLGDDRALLATDAAGLARVESSTNAIDPGTARVARVYGVPGSAVTLRSESIAPLSCPEQTWSREIVPGLAGASVAFAAADAGPRTLIALLRPRTATSAQNLLELFAADEGATALRSIASATTSATGHVAIAADRSTGRAVIAAIDGGTIELYAFDGSRLGARQRRELGVVPGGTVRGLRALPLGAARPPFAAFGDLPGGGSAIDEDGRTTALFAGAEPLASELALTPEGAVLTTRVGVQSWAWIDGALHADGELLRGPTGRLAAPAAGPVRAFVAGSTTAWSLSRAGALDAIAAPVEAEAIAAGDLDGDGRADALATVQGGARAILSASDGRLLDAGECPIAGRPKQLISLPLDRGGPARWLINLDQVGRLALLVAP